jgi:hypothetical protein
MNISKLGDAFFLSASVSFISACASFFTVTGPTPILDVVCATSSSYAVVVGFFLTISLLAKPTLKLDIEKRRRSER